MAGLVITLLFTSCGGLGMFNNDKEVANAQMDKILNAIQKKNRTELESMFSKKAIVEAENFDQSISDLFDYFQGDFISYNDWGGPSGDETWDYGNKQKILYLSYDVKTSNQEYRFAIQDFTVDTANKNNVGIWSLYIIKMEDDTNPRYAYGGDDKSTPGINIGIKSPLREGLIE